MSATEQPDGPPVPAYGRAVRMRVAVAEAASELADSARGLVPTYSSERPGTLTEHARSLVTQAQYLLELAIVCDRYRGASWETIGESLGTVSRQAAHERYAAAEKGYGEALLVTWLTGHHPQALETPAGAIYPAESAALLDRWVRQHYPEPPDYPEHDPQHPVSTGLAPMGITEHMALVTAAAALVAQASTDPSVAPAERRALDLGLARRRVELYERLQAEGDVGTAPETLADLLAGARARLAELQGDQLAERRARPASGTS